MENEKRILVDSTLETRSDEGEGSKQVLTGYALKFNKRSVNMGGFVEIIMPGALKNADMSDVRALIDHQPGKILGRTKAGTLKLSVDEVGLRFEVELPDTQYARDLYQNVELRNITQCSFGFLTAPKGDSFEHDKESGLYLRRLNNLSRITDVSVVTYPAYQDTNVDIAKRSLDQYKQSQNSTEKESLLFELDLLKLQNEGNF